MTVAELTSAMLDTKTPLFVRYQVMFALRNRGGPEAALALTAGFKDKSDLFRHEVAFVLGQMVEPVTTPALIEVLQNESEHRMVRHEAAEALGSIGGEEAEAILAKFKQDTTPVVRESCEVALDVIEYFGEE
jgi:deoxyhypusine monooxygenase